MVVLCSLMHNSNFLKRKMPKVVFVLFLSCLLISCAPLTESNNVPNRVDVDLCNKIAEQAVKIREQMLLGHDVFDAVDIVNNNDAISYERVKTQYNEKTFNDLKTQDRIITNISSWEIMDNEAIVNSPNFRAKIYEKCIADAGKK